VVLLYGGSFFLKTSFFEGIREVKLLQIGYKRITISLQFCFFETFFDFCVLRGNATGFSPAAQYPLNVLF